MADETVSGTEADGESRPCAYCGTPIHPASGRCPECCGHVALAWGTVHREHFLFLLSSILIAVGCLVPWTIRWPATTDPDQLAAAAASAASSLDGLATVRGPLMLCLAIYGIFVAVFNVLYRRMVMWPFVLNCMVALWVGGAGVARAASSPAWDAWGKKLKDTNLFDEYLGQLRAIPPGFLLLTLAGLLVALTLVKGVVAGFAAGAAKEKAKRAATTDRRARRAAGGAGDAGPATPGEPPPTAV
jgi:hypothetical protein